MPKTVFGQQLRHDYSTSEVLKRTVRKSMVQHNTGVFGLFAPLPLTDWHRILVRGAVARAVRVRDYLYEYGTVLSGVGGTVQYEYRYRRTSWVGYSTVPYSRCAAVDRRADMQAIASRGGPLIACRRAGATVPYLYSYVSRVLRQQSQAEQQQLGASSVERRMSREHMSLNRRNTVGGANRHVNLLKIFKVCL